ncbi:MAG: FAD-dependent thymidylate synthase [Pseudomonas sp.]|nr:FAD-dependent thymidylate synthase [Pseudomonas sp.]
MKIIEPSHKITFFQDNALEQIERAGRICYQSENTGSPGDFVRRLIKMGHETPLEQASATVEFVCDRGVSHELVRHRLASVNQSSTRYCNYSKEKFGNEITVIRPFFWDKNSHEYSLWAMAMDECERMYLALIGGYKATPQEARSVLPNSLKTDIVVTANMRSWRHLFKLRCSPKAHPQMRQSMLPVLAEFHRRLPVVFEDIYEVLKED